MQRDRPSPDLWTAPGVVRVPRRNDASSSGAPRGIKRERPPSPDFWTVPHKTGKPATAGPWHVPSGAPPGIKPESPPPLDLSWGPARHKRERPPSPDLWTARARSRSGGRSPGAGRPSDGRTRCAHGRRRPRHPAHRVQPGRVVLRDELHGPDAADMEQPAAARDCAPLAQLAGHRPRVAGRRRGGDDILRGRRAGKWTRIGQQNQWQWGRVLSVDAEERAPGDDVCLTCARDRIAIAFPKTGVKVWMWSKGSWRAQRSITRTNVTALKFIDDGDALLGGTRDGVLWHCAVPNGT
ncbi:hypothetical protein B0H14DRAFT_1651014 [Mycena olivaceomarginata]|nr:hypothetical protein B0H14DRAFT_1651014 [Mycena olivaceomarginata]